MTLHPAYDPVDKVWYTEEGVEAKSLAELQRKCPAAKIKDYFPLGYHAPFAKLGGPVSKRFESVKRYEPSMRPKNASAVIETAKVQVSNRLTLVQPSSPPQNFLTPPSAADTEPLVKTLPSAPFAGRKVPRLHTAPVVHSQRSVDGQVFAVHAWTDEMVEDLMKKAKAGASFKQLSHQFGVTRNAIAGKLHRLRLAGRF